MRRCTIKISEIPAVIGDDYKELLSYDSFSSMDKHERNEKLPLTLYFGWIPADGFIQSLRKESGGNQISALKLRSVKNFIIPSF